MHIDPWLLVTGLLCSVLAAWWTRYVTPTGQDKHNESLIQQNKDAVDCAIKASATCANTCADAAKTLAVLLKEKDAHGERGDRLLAEMEIARHQMSVQQNVMPKPFVQPVLSDEEDDDPENGRYRNLNEVAR